MHSRDICFDQILSLVGNDGKYQKYLLYLLITTLGFLSPWLTLPQLLQASVPDHWCYVPDKPANITLELWKNITIPTEVKDGEVKFSSCQQYQNPMQNYTSSSDEIPSLVNCTNGWNFDNTWYDETISTREQWVCQHAIDKSVWLTAGIMGSFVGTLVCNSLADIIGRKPIIIITSILFGVFGLLRLYVKSFYWILFTMFISSMSFPALLDVSFILVMEQVSNDYRAQTTFLSFVTWTFGMCLLPLIAWLSRSWIFLGIATSVPFFLYILTYWFMPESPRWLASQGRLLEAEKILQNVAKINGKTLPPNLRQMLESLPKKPVKSKFIENSFIELLKYPTIRKRTLLLTISYICNNVIYYGLMYNNENMVGNEFLNFFFLGITELPSNLLGWASSQLIGRRITSALFIGICTLTIFIVIFIPATYSVVSTSLLISAKAIVNVSFFVIYLQFVEIYPTSHRTSGTGFSTILCCISTISVPYIIYIRQISPNLPFIIFVIIGSIGVLAALLLPETLNVVLPQNIIEANNHLTSQKFWAYQGKRLKIRKLVADKDSIEEIDNLYDLKDIR